MALAALVAACAPSPPAAPPEPQPWYGHDHGPRPHLHPPSPSPYSYVSPDPSDPCGAREYRWLIGRSRGEIPPQRPNQAWRGYSTDMGVTADHHPARLNIVWDATTGTVTQVRCG